MQGFNGTRTDYVEYSRSGGAQIKGMELNNLFFFCYTLVAKQ